MSFEVEVIALVIGITVLALIFELVKQRKLREEYSVLWFLTGVLIILLTLNYNFLVFLTEILHSVFPTSIFFFFALTFLMAICLHYAVKVSMLTNQVKNLAQKLALYDSEQQELQKRLERLSESESLGRS